MCFTKIIKVPIFEETHLFQTAEEDIVVYKVVEYILKKDYCISSMRKFTYERDKLYTATLNPTIQCCSASLLICIYEGFHSCTTIEMADAYRRWAYQKIAKFIIPKGSLFMESSDYIVSNQIIFKEILDE